MLVVLSLFCWPEFHQHAPAGGDLTAMFLLTPPAQALSCDDGSVGSHAFGHSAEHLSYCSAGNPWMESA